jgi:uncharacterized protein (TIGR03067 family)
MKTQYSLTLLVAALLFAASTAPLPAADVAVDISSYNPRNPDVVLRQIELNVAIKQYEKALTEREEGFGREPIARAEIEMEMKRSQSAAEEGRARLDMLELKRKIRDSRPQEIRNQIHELIDDANADAERSGKAKAEEKTKQNAGNGKAQTDPSALLQGKWEGFEVGREAEGRCTLTVSGDTMRFQGANQDEWYQTTFTLHAGAGLNHLDATITDCPAPDFIGKPAFSIYKIEAGKLTIAGHAPGTPGAPQGFEGDRESRTFVFMKAQEPQAK